MPRALPGLIFRALQRLHGRAGAMGKPHVVILGAGPAGVGAAYRLRRMDRAEVTVVERRSVVGGNAGSFEMGGQRLDYGSHRLHPSCDRMILDDIRCLLGDDLVKRPRHGRILLNGRWIHFPLKPANVLVQSDKRFVVGMLRDAVTAPFTRKAAGAATFAAVLRAELGDTICTSFYFPYARKIWGRPPEQLAAVQARKRVSAHSLSGLLRKILIGLPGRSRQKGSFYYPRGGYGQICEAYSDAAAAIGARYLLNSRVTRLLRPVRAGDSWTIEADQNGRQRSLQADYVWSTIPVSLLARMLEPAATTDVVHAAESLQFRAMLLIYVQLPVHRFTEFDAHYFPETHLSITRLSEPKNYAGASLPVGRTTLCAELPCSVDDAAWSMSDDDLGRLVVDDLNRAGMTLKYPPSAVGVKRIRQAYPIYTQDYERHFVRLDEWAHQLPRFLSYGRQGLFTHDNTHHALAMAYAAADCLIDGVFDTTRWQRYRREFESHVVED